LAECDVFPYTFDIPEEDGWVKIRCAFVVLRLETLNFVPADEFTPYPSGTKRADLSASASIPLRSVPS
jgi:hypothetical protein